MPKDNDYVLWGEGLWGNNLWGDGSFYFWNGRSARRWMNRNRNTLIEFLNDLQYKTRFVLISNTSDGAPEQSHVHNEWLWQYQTYEGWGGDSWVFAYDQNNEGMVNLWHVSDRAPANDIRNIITQANGGLSNIYTDYQQIQSIPQFDWQFSNCNVYDVDFRCIRESQLLIHVSNFHWMSDEPLRLRYRIGPWYGPSAYEYYYENDQLFTSRVPSGSTHSFSFSYLHPYTLPSGTYNFKLDVMRDDTGVVVDANNPYNDIGLEVIAIDETQSVVFAEGG